MPIKIVLRIGLGVMFLVALLIVSWQRLLIPAQSTAPVDSFTAIQGNWRCVGMHTEGKDVPRWLVDTRERLSITGDSIEFAALLESGSTFSILNSHPNAIDIHTVTDEDQTVVVKAIVDLDDNHLRLALSYDLERPRPTAFTTRPGDDYQVYWFERIQPGQILTPTATEQLWSVLKEAQRSKGLTVDHASRLAVRCLEIAESNPCTDEAVVSLLWVLANAPDQSTTNTALALLRNREIASANLETLAECLGIYRGTIGPGTIPDRFNLELAMILLERVRRTPDHPKAAEVLCEICHAPHDATEVPPAFDQAAQMIAERWINSPDISHFLESLSSHCQRPWAGRYEPIVRSIANENPNPYIRYRAQFTLAKLIAETGESRQEEARQQFVRFVKECKPNLVDPSVVELIEAMVDQANREIDAMLVRGIGGQAPPLQGVDLDGVPMQLIDFRGKVVLLSFWGSWCNPCMQLVPHERKLAERLQGRPFVIVGVNGDDAKINREFLEKHGIHWRSFQNDRPDQKSISAEWNLAGWPTLYLIDHTGKIRRRWIGIPPLNEFDHEIERWVNVAEGKPLSPALRPIERNKGPINQGIPATFHDKLHISEPFGESKYVICVPTNYDHKTPLPIVLFLHGSGQCGTDNQKQREIGFGPAIQQNGMPFTFIGVFPQARQGSWLAESIDGKRAMAILDAVEREFPTDKRRVYLTGVSMGAEGVWSLAAAYPTRFAAIVPVCGGADPKLAEAIKNIPCWAFHGDADTIVPVHATRQIVTAITKAGGRPHYQEYRGLDHRCWDHVYAESDLYHWLQGQVRD